LLCFVFINQLNGLFSIQIIAIYTGSYLKLAVMLFCIKFSSQRFIPMLQTITSEMLNH